MDKIELNGKSYLLIEVLISGATNSDQLSEKIIKYNGIYQGIKKIKQGGFLRDGYCIINILVPEDKICDFNNEEEIEETEQRVHLPICFVYKFNALGRFVCELFKRKK